jgi:large repetitive protein
VVDMVNNTVANNDSTGTAGESFAPGFPNQSRPQPAGIVSRAYSSLLYNAIPSNGPAGAFKTEFGNPRTFVNNIVWHNRAFYWMIDDLATPPYRLVPNVATEPAVYSDLGVLGTTQQGTFPQYTDGTAHRMTPTFSILSNTSGYAVSNLSVDPMFVEEYLNGDRGQSIAIPEITTTMTAAPAFDEGGNFIHVRYGPLTLVKRPCPAVGSCLNGDYHLRAGSPALQAGTTGAAVPASDFDGNARPMPVSTNPDIGADEQ